MDRAVDPAVDDGTVSEEDAREGLHAPTVRARARARVGTLVTEWRTLVGISECMHGIG